MVIENLLAYIVRRNCETDKNGHWTHLQFSDSVKGLYLSLSLLIAMQMILSLEMQMSLSLGIQLIIVLWLLTSFASVCKFISAFLIAGIFRCDSELSLEPFVTPSQFSHWFRS